MQIGSWGTPELGITERLSNYFGQGRTASGGSNLFGNQQQTTLVPSTSMSFVPSGTSGAYGVTSTPARNVSTGGDTGGVANSPTTQLPGNLLQTPPSNDGGIDYDALIRPALDLLDQAVSPAQESYNRNVADIGSAQLLQEKQAQNIISSGEQEAGTATKSQKALTESAVDEARRQYSEISQGLQARYGGTTGTGKFANEIVGSSAMQGIGKMRVNLANAIRSIDDKRMEIRTLGEMQVLEAQQRAQELKTEAKDKFDAVMAQIRNAKAELIGNKVQYAQNAINFYNQQVASINQSNTEFLQKVYLQQQAADQQLAYARGVASSKQAELKNIGTSAVPQWAWVSNQGRTITPAGVAGAGSIGSTGYSDLDEMNSQIQ